ncbi:hypothetical protein [Pyrobaculum neutrophilum]|uniref:Uncharacterized protein n=1 Tax=Pyrobaculum neutrophilum (strain DSM 2338 / JCM 9278 / NBRC 100436 / V24Sta) TaxID=444157 RepID=B1YB79_PYRNV|nr:hypothetical protein [Pyrobaculum neutrophilum]ACB39210.1 hypothetical protein Tneu_0257 [Pyrobaculum neutrophilum V24Sta]
MNTKPLVYVLSAVAVVLGLLFLISTISAPSLDTTIFARDLVTSILAIVLGIAAPFLIKRFRSEEAEEAGTSVYTHAEDTRYRRE